MNEKSQTGRLGVSKLDHYFSSRGWLFREQFLHGYGIDAQVEIVEDEKPTGNLIAIQIKSGSSYFNEETDTDIIYRTDDKHIQYWSNHALPVIIILYNSKTDIFLWETLHEETVISTGKGWKIRISRDHVLSDDTLSAFKELTQPPPYFQKLNKLRLDKGWMGLVLDGEVLYIEFQDWVNKFLPRYETRIGCESREDIEEESWPTIYCFGLSIEDSYCTRRPLG